MTQLSSDRVYMQPGERIAGLLTRAANSVLDFVFTPRCVGCGREGTYLHQACLGPSQMPDAVHHPRAGDDRLAGVLSSFAMDGAAREAVHQLKYRGLRALAPVMGETMARRLIDSSLRPDMLLAVPLHPRRLRERGHNQAELLAQAVARRLGLGLDLSGLERVRHGAPQARAANLEERLASVDSAFRVRANVEALTVVVVDDVCTTGATLASCARALRQAGAREVWGLTFACAL